MQLLNADLITQDQKNSTYANDTSYSALHSCPVAGIIPKLHRPHNKLGQGEIQQPVCQLIAH